MHKFENTVITTEGRQVLIMKPVISIGNQDYGEFLPELPGYPKNQNMRQHLALHKRK